MDLFSLIGLFVCSFNLSLSVFFIWRQISWKNFNVSFSKMIFIRMEYLDAAHFYCCLTSKRTKSKWKRKCLIFFHISSNLWREIDIHLNLDGPPCKTFLINLMPIYSITHHKIFTTKFIHPFAFESRFSHSHSLAIYSPLKLVSYEFTTRHLCVCVCVDLGSLDIVHILLD